MLSNTVAGALEQMQIVLDRCISMLVLTCVIFLSNFTFASPPNYAQLAPKVNQSLFLDVASAGSRLVAVGERGHIVYSDDQGKSWTQAKVPTTVLLTRVFFISDQNGWAIGHDGNVLVSHNGGIDWTVQRDGLTEQAMLNEKELARAKSSVLDLTAQLETAQSEEQKAQLSEQLESSQWDVDNALVKMEKPVAPQALMDIWFINEERGWIVGAYGTLLYTMNGGRHWAPWSRHVDNPDELHFNGIAGSADGKLYIASEWGTLFRSQDWGESWQVIESGYEGSFFGVLLNPASGDVFAYGLRGNIYRSSDDGENWTELHSAAKASLFGGLAANGRLVFVGAGGTVVASEDNGESFYAHLMPEREGVNGVALIKGTSYVISGEGGSRVINLVAPLQTQPSRVSD